MRRRKEWKGSDSRKWTTGQTDRQAQNGSDRDRAGRGTERGQGREIERGRRGAGEEEAGHKVSGK